MRTVTRLAATAAAITIVALGAAGAHASSLGRPCTASPESQYLSAADLQAKAEAQGYTVSRVKIAKACGEIYARDKAGARVELFVDPTNGTIVATN
ncbi:MAG: PepSY domain-containing protein [Proteobacteria bacterium]|nr:PepSY domain-containing protein [Pseudomonadota bacterium]